MPVTILIAESERGLAALLARTLREDGFRVITSESGEAALDLAHQQRPDLILVDWALPDMDAGEWMRRHHRLAPTPIVMLAAAAGIETRVRSLEAGADDFIVKPVSPRELALRVRAVLRRSGLLNQPNLPGLERQPAPSGPPNFALV